jgi:hypothetical protein
MGTDVPMSIELLLLDHGFEKLSKGRGTDQVLRRFFRLSQVRGLMRAWMIRNGVALADPIGVHYSKSDDVILLHAIRAGLVREVGAQSPEGFSVLWHFGIETDVLVQRPH